MILYTNGKEYYGVFLFDNMIYLILNVFGYKIPRKIYKINNITILNERKSNKYITKVFLIVITLSAILGKIISSTLFKEMKHIPIQFDLNFPWNVLFLIILWCVFYKLFEFAIKYRYKRIEANSKYNYQIDERKSFVIKMKPKKVAIIYYLILEFFVLVTTLSVASNVSTLFDLCIIIIGVFLITGLMIFSTYFTSYIVFNGKKYINFMEHGWKN